MSIKSASTALITFIAAATLLSGCQEEQATAPAEGQQIPQVGIVTLGAEPFAVTTELPGRAQAYRIAEVRPQVDGIIQRRLFTEGSDVKAGQQLYQIDDAIYQATFQSAKASLASAKSLADRYALLVKEQAVSKQAFDEARAASLQAEAELERARINVRYTKVLAPISGRIGRSAVTEGALVSSGQTQALAVIQQLDPIYVDVTQAGGRLMKIKQAIQSGRIQGVENGKIEVALIIDATGVEYPHTGTLQFSDVSVNETTGTVRLRAVFPNPDGVLLPGMFVRGQVRQGKLEGAFLVPQKAVMRRPDGTAYVYTIGDGKVVSKDIQIEQSQGENWVVTDGVSDGEQLIVDGIQRIAPGAPVTAQPVENANAGQGAAQGSAQ